MRQTLFYLPTEIFGLPLFGNGLLFFAILVAGLVAIVRALFQKGRADDAWFYAAISALGLFIVKVVGPRISEDGGFPIRGYGVFLTLAIIISTVLTVWRAKRRWNYPVDSILSIVFVAAFFGVFGARTFYVVEYWDDIRDGNFRETLINIVDVTSGGLVVYGSIIGGIVAVVVYLKAKKLPILATLDLFAPALALGVSIGRVGCLMNGCCFGGVCDLPWAIVFPTGSPAHVLQMEEGVASLYGLTLEEPREISGARSVENSTASDSDSQEKSKTLFSLKSRHKNLATEAFAPIYVAAVDPGSAAEEAGIAPGARICEVGLVPKGFLTTDAADKRAEIQRFRPENNAQLFYFFLQIWAGNPEQDVWLVVQEPAKTNVDASANSAESPVATPKLRNVVFHPAPSRAVPVHPTQLYSSAIALLICVALLIFARFVRRDGLVFTGLLILYPTGRFVLETIRTDEESFCGTGLTVSQCVSLAILTVGVALFVYLKATPTRRALDGYFPPETTSKNQENKEK